MSIPRTGFRKYADAMRTGFQIRLRRTPMREVFEHKVI